MNKVMFPAWYRKQLEQSLRDYGRGAVGGLLVGLPLLYTMEMWWSGISMPPSRMLLFYLMNFGILMILETYSGFREDTTLLEEIQDAVVALGIGTLVSALILTVFNVIRAEQAWNEWAGKVILETIPVSIGVSMAVSQFGSRDKEEKEQKKKRENAGFWGRRAIALAGAVFFGFNVAPTDEPMIIGMQMSSLQCAVTAILTLVLVYGIAYSLDFRGSTGRTRNHRPMRLIFRDVLPTYFISLVAAFAILWLFGRFDPATSLAEILNITIALGFATSLGAAAGALIL